MVKSEKHYVSADKQCLSMTNIVFRLKLCISLDYRVCVEKQCLSSDKHCLSPKKVGVFQSICRVNVRNTVSRPRNSVNRSSTYVCISVNAHRHA